MQFADGLTGGSEPISTNRKHDGDAVLIFRHKARRPVQQRHARARRRVMKLLSLIAEYVSSARAHDRLSHKCRALG
jgi:hypothetical protein